MLCTPSHKWWTFTAIALTRYLTRALGYEPLEPNLIGIQENSSREMKPVGQLTIPSSFGLHLMPAGNQSRLGSVQFWEMRGGRSTCSSCSKAKANEKKKTTHKYITTVGKHKGWGWGAGNVLQKTTTLLVRALQSVHLCLRACQTGLRLDKGLNGQGLGSAKTGPQAPRIENQPHKAGLFPLVRDETIWVLWFSNPPPRSNNYKSNMPGCHWPREGGLKLGWPRATSPGHCTRRHCQV